jgi:hypothetical protein
MNMEHGLEQPPSVPEEKGTENQVEQTSPPVSEGKGTKAREEQTGLSAWNETGLEQVEAQPKRPVMIDLQEGFMDDTVVIRVGEQEVFHKEGVSTDFLLGQAESIQTEVPEGQVKVEVSVASRRVSDTVQLLVPPDSYLGVGLYEQQLTFRVSRQPFLRF